MPWFRLSFRPEVLDDLAKIEPPTAQRLLEKTKWLTSNVDNLRHEAVAADLPGLSKYAVNEWRIFYTVDREDQMVDIHCIAHERELR